MKIIDSHIHFWDTSNGFNKWVNKTELPKLVTPNDFNVDSFVHIEAHSEEIDNLCEYKWLISHFKDKKIKVIAFIDFSQNITSFEQEVFKLSKNNEIIGVRQIMAKDANSEYSPFNKEIPRDLCDKLKILKQYNMIFDCQMYPNQILSIIFDIIGSNVICVFEHMGLPVYSNDNNIFFWKDLLLAIQNNKNLYLKLSGGDLNNKDAGITKILHEIKNAVSSSKLCYGSNYPISNKTEYNKWFNMVCSVFTDIQDRENIFYNTANKLYQFSF